MTLSVTPAGGGVQYSPERDLAYLFTTLCREAFSFLREDTISDEDRQFLCEQGGTLEELITPVVQSFAKSLEFYVGPAKVSSCTEALSRAGYYSTPIRARRVFEAALGRVLILHGFVDVRTSIMVGQLPPYAVGLPRPMLAVKEWLEPHYAKLAAVDCAVELSFAQVTIKELEKRNEQLTRKIAELQASCRVVD